MTRDLLRSICEAHGDPAPIVLEVYTSGTVYVLTTEDWNPDFREEIADKRAAGVRLIIDHPDRLSAIVQDLIIRAKLDATDRERALSWMDRLRRWWGGR